LKEDLKSESREVRRPEPPVDRPSFSKPLLITAAVGLVLSAVAVVYFATRGGDTGEQAPPQTMQAEEAPVVRTRPSIAILAVQGLSPDPSDSWLSTALAEMLATEIGIGESLRVIPRETVARVSQEISLADPDAPAGPAAQQLRKMLNSEFVVSGSYVLSGDKPDRQIRLDLQIQDTASGETVGLVSERQPEGQLFVLVERLGSALREKLEVDEAVEAAEALGKPAFPSTSEAVRHYSQGLEKLQIYDAAAAVDLLTRATKSDPQFPGAHSALAAAWGKLGLDEKAAAEAELAFQLSEGFAREDRLAAEAVFRELGGDWQKATEIYQALFGFFPDDLDYGLSLAAAQTAADRADDALATVASLRKLPGPTAADPRIDLAEADAHSKLTDFSSMAAAASTAAEKAYAIGAQLLFAQARLAEGDALVRLGEFDEGRQRLAKAGEIYADAGDRAHQAYVENATAISFAYEGDLETARDGFQNALEISREIGDRGGISNHLNNLANMRASLGDPAGARENYYEVLDIARKMGHKTNTALALNNIGTTFFEEGIFDRAIGAYEEALDLFRETGASLHVAICLSNIAEVLHGQGSLVLAEENYRQALEVVRGLGDPWEVAEVQFHLAQVLNDQGDSNGAVELLKDSQQGYSLAGDPEGEANATRKAAEIEAETVNEQ